MPLACVARILGHSDTATTNKVYIGFFPDDFAADMERLDAYIAPPATVPVSLLDTSGLVTSGEI